MTHQINLEQCDDAFTAADYLKNIEDPLLPNGNYWAVVEKFDVRKSKNGNPMLAWNLKILASAGVGRTLYHNRVISEKSIGYIKNDLVNCGLILGKFSDLPIRQHELIGLILKVYLFSINGSQNISIIKPISRERYKEFLTKRINERWGEPTGCNA